MGKSFPLYYAIYIQNIFRLHNNQHKYIIFIFSFSLYIINTTMHVSYNQITEVYCNRFMQQRSRYSLVFLKNNSMLLYFLTLCFIDLQYQTRQMPLIVDFIYFILPKIFFLQLRYCFQKVLQLHSTVQCIYEPPLLNVDFLHYRLLRRHELLRQSILLLDIFCWCKLSMGCDSNADSNKELEVDKPGISVLQGESRLSKPTLCPRHQNYLGSMTPAWMGTTIIQ